jgi:hypothetical protein
MAGGSSTSPFGDIHTAESFPDSLAWRERRGKMRGQHRRHFRLSAGVGIGE